MDKKIPDYEKSEDSNNTKNESREAHFSFTPEDMMDVSTTNETSDASPAAAISTEDLQQESDQASQTSIDIVDVSKPYDPSIVSGIAPQDSSQDTSKEQATESEAPPKRKRGRPSKAKTEGASGVTSEKKSTKSKKAAVKGAAVKSNVKSKATGKTKAKATIENPSDKQKSAHSSANFPAPYIIDFSDRFDPKKVFNGKLIGYGTITATISRVMTRFSYSADLSWVNDELTFMETVAYSDGKQINREVHLHFAQNGSVSGYGDDIVGKVHGILEGSSLRLEYALNVQWKNTQTRVYCNDINTAIDDNHIVGKISINKLMLPWSTVQTFLTKV